MPGASGRPVSARIDQVIGLILSQQDREATARHALEQDAEDAVEELLQVEDGVELGCQVGEDRELAARPHLFLRGLDHAASLDHRDELVDHRRVVPRACQAPQLSERHVGAQRDAIRTVGEHRVIPDDHVEDPGRPRDRFTGEAVRIARAVPAFVRVAHDRHDAFQEADRLEDARSEQRVLAHDRDLLGRERTVLAKDRGRDADLAERMEQRRVPKIALLLRPQANALAQRKRVRGDAALMVLAIVVAGLDRGGERRDRREVGIVELAVEPDASDGGRAEARRGHR